MCEDFDDPGTSGCRCVPVGPSGLGPVFDLLPCTLFLFSGMLAGVFCGLPPGSGPGGAPLPPGYGIPSVFADGEKGERNTNAKYLYIDVCSQFGPFEAGAEGASIHELCGVFPATSAQVERARRGPCELQGLLLASPRVSGSVIVVRTSLGGRP